jgi:hypothetical protein
LSNGKKTPADSFRAAGVVAPFAMKPTVFAGLEGTICFNKTKEDVKKMGCSPGDAETWRMLYM